MFQKPQINLEQRHISTSSSVYSPTASQFEPNAEPISEYEWETDDEYDEFLDSEANNMIDDRSQNTLPTFITAQGGSINGDERSNNSIAGNSTKDENSPPYDADATPRYDEGKFVDLTPKLGQRGTAFSGENNLSVSSSLPHGLSRKFQRLSTTLQQLNKMTSNDSFQFMSSFQLNIDHVNNLAFDNQEDIRTSAYYKKIDQINPNDDKRESSVIDQVSESSTVSKRSSLISQENEPTRYHDFRKSQKPSMTFSKGTPLNHELYLEDVAYSNGHDDDDDIPVRRDLLARFDNMGLQESERDISEKDKVKRMISMSSSRGSLYRNFSDSRKNGRDDKPKADSSLTHEDTLDSNAPSITGSNQLALDDLSDLFIRALHSFDSSTLQLESDASICLSFKENELAFVHTIDESGWGEATLIDSLERGWIPMNYFTTVINSENEETKDFEENDLGMSHSLFLKSLLHACGAFLINPLSYKDRYGNYTFSVKVLNAIRDGVRNLLLDTGCLSRSNEIVSKSDEVRKARKSLLGDWYSLMLKANEFKGTYNFSKIEILTLMIFQVTSKAIVFLKTWSFERKRTLTEEARKRHRDNEGHYPMLLSPPKAKARVTEINGILYSYLGLIIGRLDMIEHNSIGCDILETMAHHIILLLRELLFISKTGSDISFEKPHDLDDSLDFLLSLVSELVSSVKSLVMKTLNETTEEQVMQISKKGNQSVPTQEYYYTEEGGKLIEVSTKMIEAVSKTINSVRKLQETTGDFTLSDLREYPDYSKMRIEPARFIRECSLGIAKSPAVKMQANSINENASNRYSMMRNGKPGQLGITAGGATILQDILGQRSSFLSEKPEVKPFTTNVDKSNNNKIDLKNDLLIDSHNHLVGATFRGLILTLTNEEAPPEDFFVSTFFICFRHFVNGIDLLEALIDRFDVKTVIRGNTKANIEDEVLLKSRRKLIVRVLQLWMESFWNENDRNLLTTLINFFNEGISLHSPLDAIKLLEIVAKLSSSPLTESGRNNKIGGITKQLVKIRIGAPQGDGRRLIEGKTFDDRSSARDSVVDGYELSKINTNSSNSSSKSTSLPVPAGIGLQTSLSSQLLSKSTLAAIEKQNLKFRLVLGDSWAGRSHLESKKFIPMKLNTMIERWSKICEADYEVSDFRPNLTDFSALEVAKQLTLIESSIFCSITAEELLNENYTSKKAHLRLAPNITKSLLFTNNLSAYVLESILQPGIPCKARASNFKIWLKVAISCLYLRNFNSLAAIITALQSHLISRLTVIWDELSDKYKELYNYLVKIIHPEKNYSVYRSKLRTFLDTANSAVPLIPYLSLFLQDLTFVTDGNPDFRKANSFLGHKMINIVKYMKITRILADIELLQIPYATTLSTGQRRISGLFLSFNRSSTVSTAEDYSIIPVPELQEMILLELWKISLLNRRHHDRAWKLSCSIRSKETK